MSDYSRFDELFAAAESSSKRDGKYISLLSVEDRALLDEFSVWAQPKLSEASGRSYRTYLAKWMTGQPVDRNMRSAVKLFKSFLQSK